MSDNDTKLSSSSSDGSHKEIESNYSSDLEDESPHGTYSNASYTEKSDGSENSYDETNNCDDRGDNNIEQEYVHGEKRRREKKSEAEKTLFCLSDDAINSLINKCKCTAARMTGSCPNDFKCADFMTQQFGLIKTRNVLKQFRLKYWTHSEVNKSAAIKNRRLALLRDLNTMYLRDENHRTGIIEYKISGQRVCKSFYFEATGISTRMFNDAVSYTLGKRTSADLESFLNKTGKASTIPVPKKLKTHLSNSRSEHVVKFLNHYFTYSVEWSPHERDVRYIHMTFKYLYKHFYLAYCDKRHFTPVTLEQFYRIRKHCCPNYKKSKTIRPGGWNHVRCDTCDRLQRDIMRCEEESEECRQRQKEFLSHIKKQDCCR